jgi:NAD(P)-dependent dehydrogenase (short-subunit alcohol dehydrogenase family)
MFVLLVVGCTPSVDEFPVVFITGSNRGIGLELTRQYAARGWTVIATCRKPREAHELREIADEHPAVRIVQLDVLDFDRIDELAEQYRSTPIDILINNAGISGGSENQVFGRIKYAYFADVMRINVEAPLKLAEALLESVAASRLKKIVTISSTEGSITMTGGPGRGYFYRPSKTAVNMVMRNLAIDVADRDIVVGLVNPGAVDTDFMKGVPIPLMPVNESVLQVIQVIDSLDIESSGSFLNYDGETLPW